MHGCQIGHIPCGDVMIGTNWHLGTILFVIVTFNMCPTGIDVSMEHRCTLWNMQFIDVLADVSQEYLSDLSLWHMPARDWWDWTRSTNLYPH